MWCVVVVVLCVLCCVGVVCRCGVVWCGVVCCVCCVCCGVVSVWCVGGVCIHVAAASLTTQRLAFDLETNLLISLCFFIFALLIFPDPAVSCAVSKHNKEGLTANMTNLSVRRNDAHDHAPAHQGVSDASRQDHMSPSRSEKLSAGRFALSLCLCLSGVAWRGVAWRGVAWRGVAWSGVERRGAARRGLCVSSCTKHTTTQYSTVHKTKQDTT